MKLILTDIDDTVLRFGDKFEEWCIDTKKLATFGGRLRESASIEDFLQCDRERATELVIEFSTCPNTMPFLEPEPCAQIYVPKLYEMGYQFAAISSCVDGPVVTQMRRENLERAFGIPWLDVTCVGLLAPKHEALRQHEPTFWVEDNANNALLGAELGHQTFLLDRSYNRHVQAVSNPFRVPDWQAIYMMIKMTEEIDSRDDAA
jgi:hypothetical protein